MSVLKWTRFHKALRVIALCDDLTNRQIGDQLVAEGERRRGFDSRVTCHLHVNSYADWDNLLIQDLATTGSNNLVIEWFNRWDLLALREVRERLSLPIETPGAQTIGRHVVVYGNDRSGRSLATAIARHGVKDLQRLRVTLIGTNAEAHVTRSKDQLLSSESPPDLLMGISLSRPDERSPIQSLARDSFLRGERVSDIYVCTEGKDAPLSTASWLAGMLAPQISPDNLRVVYPDAERDLILLRNKGANQRVSNEKPRRELESGLESTNQEVLLLDGSGAIYSNLDNGSPRHFLGRIIHETWLLGEIHHPQDQGSSNETPSLDRDEWENQTPAQKADSLDNADALGAQLASFNLGLLRSLDEDSNRFVLRETDASWMIETLARQEHERWCKSKFARGFKKGPRKTDDQHPDLVSWEDLNNNSKKKTKEMAEVQLLALERLPLGLNIVGKSPSQVYAACEELLSEGDLSEMSEFRQSMTILADSGR